MPEVSYLIHAYFKRLLGRFFQLALEMGICWVTGQCLPLAKSRASTDLGGRPQHTDRSESVTMRPISGPHARASTWEGRQLQPPSSFQSGHKQACSSQVKDPHLVFDMRINGLLASWPLSESWEYIIHTAVSSVRTFSVWNFPWYRMEILPWWPFPARITQRKMELKYQQIYPAEGPWNTHINLL